MSDLGELRAEGNRARGRVPRVFAAFGVVVALVVAGCGSSSSSSSAPASGGGSTSSASSGGSGGSAAQQAVFALATQLLQRPTTIPVTQPVGKPIPAGKKLIWIDCGAPVCHVLGLNFQAGAAVLGWTTQIIPTDGTPTSILAAWKQAVTAKPDGVASSGTDVAVVGTQLQQLMAEGVPVVQYSIPKTAPGVTLLIGDGAGISQSFSEPQAAYIAKTSQGHANTLYVTIPAFPILQNERAGFVRVYNNGCPGCPLQVLELPVTSLGKDVPQRIISALRANSSINYLAVSVDDFTVGIPAQLKAAGLADKVKIVGASSTATNFQYIATGQELAGVPNDIPGLTWQMVDGFARIFTKQPTTPDTILPRIMIVDKTNLPSSNSVFPFVVDYQAQFKKLWGK